MNFYTSDMHFFHEHVFTVSKRPFKNIIDMNCTIIKNWNDVVKETDTVFVLGDICDGALSGEGLLDVFDIIKNLHGKKYLVAGNHDDDHLQEIKDSKIFEEVGHILYAIDDGQKIAMCHYPLASWRRDYLDTNILLYGHLHNQEIDYIDEFYKNLKKSNKIAINVGQDVQGFVPKTLKQLLSNV